MSMNNKDRVSYISAEKIAQALEVPVEAFKWTLEKYKKQDGLTEGKDYIVYKDKMYFTLSGLLWAVSRCDGNFRGAVTMAEKLATSGEMQKALESYGALAKALPELQAALSLAQETVEKAIQAQPDVAGGTEEDNKRYYKKNAAQLPPLNETQSKWATEMHRLLEAKSKENGKMPVHIQTYIYRRMTKDYGIVWKQQKIDTLKRFDLESDTAMTTFRCVCYSEKLQSLYKSILEDYGKKAA